MNKRLDPYAFSIYHLLKTQSDAGFVTVAYSDLIDETGWSLDTINRCMGLLMAEGRITRVSGGKNRKPSTYRIS